MAEGDTLFNAVLGAVVTTFLSPVPFAPLLGGAVAGYLQGGERSDGLRVGLLSGLIGFVFATFFGGILLLVFGALVLGLDRPLAALSLVAVLVAGVVGSVYVVGLSTAGGWLGTYLKSDTGVGR